VGRTTMIRASVIAACVAVALAGTNEEGKKFLAENQKKAV